MELKFKIIPPMMPNFVRYEKPAGLKQDGIDTKDEGIAVENFTAEQAAEFGELMKTTFIEHWKKRCESKN